MKKKILSTVLVFTMAFSMVACGSNGKGGSKVTVTVDEVQTKMTEAIKKVESADISLDAAVGISMDAEGQKMEMDLDFDADGKLTVGTPAGYVKYSASMKSSGAGDNQDQKVDGEAYLLTEGDNATVYYSEDKDWYKTEGSLEELMAEFESSLASSGMSMDELLESATKEGGQKPELSGKTVEAEGKECYELVFKMDKDMLAKEMETLGGDMVGDVQAALDMFNTFEGDFKAYVDVDTYLPVKMVLGVDLKADIMGATLNLDEFDFTITADYNKVKEITVPSDVKDKAVDVSE